VATAHEILAGLERFGIRLGLDHLRDLALSLGHPEAAAPTVIVAGTNGKGSIAALLASMARAAGVTTGLYTSPHLERVGQRIQVDGRELSETALGELLEKILANAAQLGHGSPTYFEAMTLAAWLHFARVPVGLAVLEVGMGGRLDATNLATAELSVIAAIALDHQEFLGSSLDLIAREKAGVMRAGRPSVLSPQLDSAREALLDEAGKRGACAVEAADEVVGMEVTFRGLAGLALDLSTRRRRYRLQSPLAGRHQAWNIATAVVAAEQFAGAGLPEIGAAAIVAGVADCRWPGRLEALALTDRATTVLLDAAHNPAGCEALAAFLDELALPFTLLFGALADKDLAQMLPTLAERAERIVLTRPDSPRAAAPATLAALLPERSGVTIEPDIAAALEESVRAGPELVVACGSIFLIGALRTLLRPPTARPGR
jgi:dihydrofolate synthase / folylpolyglutamate synthase